MNPQIIICIQTAIIVGLVILIEWLKKSHRDVLKTYEAFNKTSDQIISMQREMIESDMKLIVSQNDEINELKEKINRLECAAAFNVDEPDLGTGE